MSNPEITELKRIFLTRLDVLGHILDVAEKHLPDVAAALAQRLAPDMYPLGTQIAFACNQPRGFSQWSAGAAVENLPREVETLELARRHILDTKARVAAIAASDSKLDEVKRTGLGPGRYCDLPARQYINDYVLPNFYFHITTTYAILRGMGVPLGKSDFMAFLAPHVRQEA
ncbi:MAG TPA: DUF1993 domain-containing protein [Rhodanobacteraceae bacterium]|nr:DUF1993 domain-containing protein [Rhodanobacteraceae bacterium]